MTEHKKSICLIIPPSVFLLDERVFMSLGILRVAAVLENAGHHVKVLDLSGVSNYTDVVAAYIQNSQVRLFGITATTPQLPAAVNVARAIRKQARNSRIILGGPHVSLVAAAYKREKNKKVRKGRAKKAFEAFTKDFDVVVAGDGEGAIFSALDADPPPYIDADDPKSSLFLTNNVLNELPFPARHLVDVDTYEYHIDGERALSLIAQLGCPYACGFCGGRYSPFLRRTRMRSSENIIVEIEHMYRNYGIKGFMFYDDELNVNPKMVELMNGITDLQNKLNVKFRLRGFIKAQLFTEAQAAALVRAGFKWILVGFESGSPRILKNINKKSTREENTRCMDIARRYGLKVKALMSLGHPGESEQTARETREWLLDVRPEDFDITVITTYAGTPYYDDAVPCDDKKNVWVYTYNGDRLYSYEVDYTSTPKYYKGDPDGGYQAFVYTDYLSSEEIVKWRDFIEKDVRKKLNVPFPKARKAIRYEHSMGQWGPTLPRHILRETL